MFIADRVPHRLKLATRMGADVATTTSGMREAVADETHGRGVDVVLDAAGAVETINAGIALARAGGQFVLIGIPSVRHLDVDLHTAMAKELRIQTVKRSNHNAHGACELLLSGRVPEVFLTHLLPLDRTPEAFAMLDEYSDGVGKVIVQSGA